MTNKDCGIVSIAMGKTYEKVAVATVAHSRRHTSLPILVFTDLPEHQRSPLWAGISDVEIRVVDLHWSENRHIKTALHLYTPFKRTLFIDCDAAIIRPGIEDVLARLDNCDFLLCQRREQRVGDDVPEFYLKIYRQLGARLPMTGWYGAFFAFDRDNARACDLLQRWNTAWAATEKFADLPPLNHVVKQVQAATRIHVVGPSVFSLNPDDDPVVWHPTPGNPAEFCSRLGIEVWKPARPTSYKKWNMVKENAELPKNLWLPEPEPQSSGPCCVTAYVWGAYAEYAPFLALSALWSYPDYSVKIISPEKLNANAMAGIQYIRRQLSPNVSVIQSAQIPMTTVATGIGSAKTHELQQKNKIGRWLVPGDFYRGFDTVYMTDADFLIVPETPALMQQHLAICERLGSVHSNTQRWNSPGRMSGLQLVRTREYFAATDPVTAPYRSGLKAVPALHNEEFLQQLMVKAGLAQDLRPETRAEFDNMRPHHGYHVGLMRYGHDISGSGVYYNNIWKQYAVDALPIVTSPLFDYLLSRVSTSWVRASLVATRDYICAAARGIARGPAAANEFKHSQRSSRLSALETARTVRAKLQQHVAPKRVQPQVKRTATQKAMAMRYHSRSKP